MGRSLQPSREWREVASAVSRLNHTLTEQYEAWRERPLPTQYRIIYAGR